MPKLQLNASELVDIDPSFVSLVKRGANRIPFRITKTAEEEPMDLYKIGRMLKGETNKPEIVAAILAPGTDALHVASLFKAAGLDPKKFVKNEKGGVTTVKKADVENPENAIILKMDGGVSLVVSHLQKSFSPWCLDSTDFDETMAAQGFRTSLYSASDALSSVISTVLDDARTPQEASEGIGKAIDSYKAFITGAFDTLPVQVFKMEQLLKADAKKKAGKTMPNEDMPNDGDAATDQDGKPQNAGMKKGASLGDEPPADTMTPEQLKRAKAKKDGNAMSPDQYSNTGAAGLNGTGAGAAAGEGTGTTPRATADDLADTPENIAATAGKSTTGNANEGPAEAKNKASGLVQGTGTDGIQKTDAPNGANLDPDKDGDDDSIMTGFLPGDDTGFAAAPTDSNAATARATADDKKNLPTSGTVDGSSIPDGDSGISVHKNDGDAAVGKKGQGNTLPDDESGAGAQVASGSGKSPTIKGEDAILAAIAQLQKSFDAKIDGVRSEVGVLGQRVAKAEADLNGTVFNEAGGDNVRAVTQKSEGAGAPPLLDTGYSRRAG